MSAPHLLYLKNTIISRKSNIHLIMKNANVFDFSLNNKKEILLIILATKNNNIKNPAISIIIRVLSFILKPHFPFAEFFKHFL